MTEFVYEAKTTEGQMVKGEVEAAGKEEAVALLHKEGIFILNLERKKQKISQFFQKRVSLKEKIVFTNELAIMIRSGLPVVKSLESLQEQTTNQYFASVIEKIIVDVKGGDPLSEALAKYPDIFPPLYISVTKSGEKAGKLDEVFLRLAQQLDKDYALLLRVKGAMLYPAFILGALIIVIVLIMIFVMPQLEDVFNDLGASLPLTTNILLKVSSFVRHLWYLLLILILLMFVAYRYLARSHSGGAWLDRIKIKLPLFGQLLRKVYMARFARTAATLVSAGLPLLQTLQTLEDVIGNRVYKEDIKKVEGKVETGYQLSAALKQSPLFPAMFTNLISVGEQAGNLDQALINLADFFDREVENTTKNLSDLIEPILIVLVGIGIALVIASVLMPIYNLVNVV